MLIQSHMFASVQNPRLKHADSESRSQMKVTSLNLKFHACSLSLSALKGFLLNLSNVCFSGMMCRTHNSTRLTQGHCHNGRSWSERWFSCLLHMAWDQNNFYYIVFHEPFFTRLQAVYSLFFPSLWGMRNYFFHSFNMTKLATFFARSGKQTSVNFWGDLPLYEHLWWVWFGSSSYLQYWGFWTNYTFSRSICKALFKLL